MQELDYQELNEIVTGLDMEMKQEAYSILKQNKKTVEWRIQTVYDLAEKYIMKFETRTGLNWDTIIERYRKYNTFSGAFNTWKLVDNFKFHMRQKEAQKTQPVVTTAISVIDQKAKVTERVPQEKDVYTDRSLSLLWSKDHLNIEGLFSYRVKWCHDVITQMLWNWIQKENIPKQEESLLEFEKTDDIIHAINEVRSELPVIVFTDTDFRNVTGLNHLSGEEIKELFEEYKQVRIRGAVSIYYDSRTKDYIRVHLNDPLYDVQIFETGSVSKGQKPVYYYVCTMNLFGFILYNNLLQHKLKGYSKEFFQLKGGEQEIYRVVSLLKKARYKYTTLVSVLGLSESPKNLRTQKAGVEKYLNGLKDKGFIKSWRKDKGRGTDTMYFIERTG